VTLRAALIGCGRISRSHASAYVNLDGIELAALCNIDSTAANVCGVEHGVTRCYTDYEQMLLQEQLALVSMCAHAPLHAPITIACANKGVNVLCEKPLSVDLESADHMLKSCRDAGVHLPISHQFRFAPILGQVKKLIEDGHIGELRSIRGVGKGRPPGFELMEMGVHYFDEMEFFLGNIGWVLSQIS